MVRIFVSLLALAVMTAPAVAQTPEPSLFGITLGKPLAVPECPKKSGRYDLSAPRQGICAERDAGSDEEWGGRSIDLHFPSMGHPKYMRPDVFFVSLIDGKVVRIGFATPGVPAEREVLGNLKEKFGNPTEITSQGHDVSWRFADFAVEHWLDRTDWGIVELQNTVYIQTYQKWTDAQQKSKPKM